jgi:hypothetical protein
MGNGGSIILKREMPPNPLDELVRIPSKVVDKRLD